MSQCEALIEQAKSIINKDIEKKKTTCEMFNVFSILNMERDEVNTHGRFLYQLLNPQGLHYQGSVFLKLFLNLILPDLKFEQKQLDLAKVSREFVFDNGKSRIDLIIEIGDYIIPIELKIDADDQNLQVERYYKYAQLKSKEARVVYLTLDGHDPSVISQGGVSKECIVIASFEVHIRDWLIKCLKTEPALNHSRVSENLIQYLSILKKITNQTDEGVIMEVKKMIKDRESFEAAKAISDTLEEIKIEKLIELLGKLHCFIEDSLHLYCLNNNDFIERCKNYYLQQKSSLPNLIYKIDNSSLLIIEIDHRLYYGVKTESSAEYIHWDYIPSKTKTPNFKDMSDENYLNLFSEEGISNFIKETCDKIKLIFDNLKRDNQC